MSSENTRQETRFQGVGVSPGIASAMDVCDSEDVPHPAIVNEGGRAIVAHHSVLVVEAFSSIEKTVPKVKVEVTEKDHKLVRDILDVKQRLKRGNRLESLHDIQQIKEEAQETFNLGLLDLESKAKLDCVYWQLAQQIVNMGVSGLLITLLAMIVATIPPPGTADVWLHEVKLMGGSLVLILIGLFIYRARSGKQTDS